MKLNPNAPAFPSPPEVNSHGTIISSGRPGLTVRAHLAGLAMQGLAAAPGFRGFPAEKSAQLAVSMADALIAELNKDAPPPREARDGEIIGWSVKHGIRDLSNKDLRAAFEAARNLDLSKP